MGVARLLILADVVITGATPHHNKDRDNLTPTKLNISLTREGGSSSYVGGKSDPTKWLDFPNLSIIILQTQFHALI